MGRNVPSLSRVLRTDLANEIRREETMTEDLRLHHELLLIALRDETGTPESRASSLEIALGGALLAELLLSGRISIAEDTKKKLVELADSRPFGDEVLDECLELVAEARRRGRASHWVSRFAHRKRLRHRVAASLCRRGILEDSEASLLLVFKRKAYPTIDPEPEARLVARLRQAIESEEEVDPRTAILLALAHRTGLLRIHFDKKTLKRRKERLESVAEGEAIGAATREAIQAAQAAVIAATTAATIAATSANS